MNTFDFWQKSGLSNWWNTFKLRGGYGQSGNLTAIGAYDRFTSYSFSPFLGSASSYANTQLGDLNLNVERQNETEIGADLSFLNDRLGLEITYYSKVTIYDSLPPTDAILIKDRKFVEEIV